MRLTAVFVLMATLAGCRFLGWPGFGENDDRRDEWESISDGEYTFVMNRGCFCIPAGVFDVTVEDYEIVSMVSRITGESVAERDLQWVHTIDQMFDLIDEANRDADEVRVEYADEGYPTEIQIDWILQAADDEIFYGVSDVVITSN